MTAFDYARPKATAERLITRFGQPGTLRRPASTGPAYNPTAGTPADQAVTFVVTEYSNREVDGTRILATDKKVLLAKGSLTIEPATSDLLLDADAKPYKVIAVMPLKPAQTVVLFELQVRR